MTTPFMELAGKTVLVVGGTSGMGAAVARGAVAAGARVIVASRSAERVRQTAGGLGPAASGEVADMTDQASVERLWSRAGTVDHLVIAAASLRIGGLKTGSVEDARLSMDSKFWGPYRLIRASSVAADGSIVLFSGAAGRRPGPATASLSAINAAVEALGKALALELRPVRVNVVSPGLVDTEFWDGFSAEAKSAIFDRAARRLPVGRVGTADEIAAVVMTLLTNRFMTGSVVDIDGGDLLV